MDVNSDICGVKTQTGTSGEHYKHRCWLGRAPHPLHVCICYWSWRNEAVEFHNPRPDDPGFIQPQELACPE